jgi:ankyrin repeat protein
MPSKAFNQIWDLCRDRESSESELISQLKSVLTNPEVLNETNDNGQTLLHFAAEQRSVEFIKLLVETDGGLESVMMADNFGYLPIHLACCNCNLEAAKYLHPIYPESINIADNYGLPAALCSLE